MEKPRLYKLLTLATGFIGLGMLLGNAIGNGTSSLPTWIGGLLILGAAVLFGMSVAAPKDSKEDNQE